MELLGCRWAAILVRAQSHPPLEGSDLALVPIADLVRAVRPLICQHVLQAMPRGSVPAA